MELTNLLPSPWEVLVQSRNTAAQFSSAACLCHFVVSVLQSHLFSFAGVLHIWEASPHLLIFSGVILCWSRSFFKGLFSGFLNNVHHPSQFLLSLMFSLHLPFPRLPAPAATTLSPQNEILVDEFWPEDAVYASLWVTCNAVEHAAACIFSARTDHFILFPFFMQLHSYQGIKLDRRHLVWYFAFAWLLEKVCWAACDTENALKGY